jgi:mannose-6-phosphate isomerase-like protein (cupin superfamily)
MKRDVATMNSWGRLGLLERIASKEIEMPVFETLGQQIGANVSVIAVDLAPGEGPALHRHTYPEVFVVLEGQATFTLAGEERVVGGGEAVVAPTGVAHRFVNSGTGRLRQVNIHESPRFDTEWL